MSRGFRAPKTWFALKVVGSAALERMMAQSCEVAQYLRIKVGARPELDNHRTEARDIDALVDACLRFGARQVQALV